MFHRNADLPFIFLIGDYVAIEEYILKINTGMILDIWTIGYVSMFESGDDKRDEDDYSDD